MKPLRQRFSSAARPVPGRVPTDTRSRVDRRRAWRSRRTASACAWCTRRRSCRSPVRSSVVSFLVWAYGIASPIREATAFSAADVCAAQTDRGSDGRELAQRPASRQTRRVRPAQRRRPHLLNVGGRSRAGARPYNRARLCSAYLRCHPSSASLPYPCPARVWSPDVTYAGPCRARWLTADTYGDVWPRRPAVQRTTTIESRARRT